MDIRRHPNHHLSFGTGVHQCLGAGLARLELRLVLETLLARVQHIRRTETPLELVEGLNYGVKRCEITFDKQDSE